MFKEIVEELYYSCGHCGKVFESVELLEEHLETCIWNGNKRHTCITCKNVCYKLVPPYAKENNYDILRKEGIVSSNSYFECSTGEYSGRLTEDKILREDKQCYEPRKLGTTFNVERGNEYSEYQNILSDISVEQDKIDAMIEEFWSRVQDLSNSGLSEQEILEILEEEFKDE